MFDVEDLDLDEYDEEIPTPASSLHYMDGLAHPDIVDSVGYLFKLCLKIEDISEKLQECEFQTGFLFLPIISFKANEAKGVLFPMNRNNFSKFKTPTLFVSAVSDGHTIGTADVDVSQEFKNLEEEYESFPDCFPVLKTEHIIFSLGAEKIGEANFMVQFLCLGPSQMEGTADLTNVKAPDSDIPGHEVKKVSTDIASKGNIGGDSGEEAFLGEDEEPEFDEYLADINGNSLTIKILRKNDQQNDNEVCECTGVKSGKAIPSGGIGRRGSQVIFQMPTKLDLCTKNPPSVVSYNVGNCLKQTEHLHGTEKMKIDSGKSHAELGNQKVDKFVLKIGKKDTSKESRGRLELELFTPKLVTVSDFKKPCQSKSVQTDSDEKGKKKRKNS